MKDKTRTLNVALPDELVKKADKAAERESRNRSELIREALRVYLQGSVSKTIGVLLPQRTEIFNDLVKQSLILVEAAKVFESLVHDWKKLDNSCLKLKQLEHEADSVVHKITDDIEKTFMLSLDKEDVKSLAESVDDVMDGLEEAANRFKIYKVSKSNYQLREFSALITQMTKQLQSGISFIKNNKFSSKDFLQCCRDIHQIESKGDELHRKILAEMMGKRRGKISGEGVLSIIAWREIFQTLEDVLDKCENIAIIFDRLRLKYS